MSPSRIGRRARGFIIAAAVLVALLVVWGVRGRARESRDGNPDRATGAGSSGARGGRGSGNAADRVVPVQVVSVESRDIPIYLEGLGSIAAFKTVNVRTQVDGRLNRVAFKEGQAVRKGDLLAEVDPRPFMIQLHTAEAALARDQAQLAGAERNLERYESVRSQHLIPEQQVDDQRALAEQMRATVKSDQAQIENARLQLAYARITSPIDGITGIRLVDQGNVVHASDANGIVVVNQVDPIAAVFTLPQDDLPRVVQAQRQGEGQLVVEALSRDGDKPLATGELALIDNQINQSTATMRLKAIFPNRDHSLWPNQFVKVRLRLTVRRGALVVPSAAIQHGQQGTFVYVVEADKSNPDQGKPEQKPERGRPGNDTDRSDRARTNTGKGGAGAGAGEALRAAVRKVQVESVEGTLAIIAAGLRPGERIVSEGQNQLRANARVAVREPADTGASGGDATGAAGRRTKRQP